MMSSRLPLNATRSLDASIAEKLIGWQNVRLVRVGKQEQDWLGAQCAGCYDERIPDYSTKIADAWTVIERLESKGLLIRLIKREPHAWECHILGAEIQLPVSPHEGPPPIGHGATAPLAIVLGALATV